MIGSGMSTTRTAEGAASGRHRVSHFDGVWHKYDRVGSDVQNLLGFVTEVIQSGSPRRLSSTG
jgi:hypothetical protein